MVTREKLLNSDLENFLSEHDILRGEFDKTGLDVAELNAIARDHTDKTGHLTLVADLVSNTLQRVSQVHSVKARLKSADSLVAKVIRKGIEKPDRIIDLKTYEKEITDLVGVRALHLFKGQWKPISEFAKNEWEEIDPPVAYHRAGDADEVIRDFQNSGLRTEVRLAGYRSVHHVIGCVLGRTGHPVEIQIRTVFEEAWAEIDHIVRYPRKSDNPELAGFLRLFNAFAGTADDMGTYLMSLRQWLVEYRESVSKERKRADNLEAQVARLKISERERVELQREIAAIRTAAATLSPPVFMSTSTGPGQVFNMGNSPMSGGAVFDAPYVVPNVVKTCPNGHFFNVPAIGLTGFGGHRCPMCNASVY